MSDTHAIVRTILNCPNCGKAHVDRDEWANKPHKTHLCEFCKHAWKPFDYYTAGINDCDHVAIEMDKSKPEHRLRLIHSSDTIQIYRRSHGIYSIAIKDITGKISGTMLLNKTQMRWIAYSTNHCFKDMYTACFAKKLQKIYLRSSKLRNRRVGYDRMERLHSIAVGFAIGVFATIVAWIVSLHHA